MLPVILAGCLAWGAGPLFRRARLARDLAELPLAERGRAALESAGKPTFGLEWRWLASQRDLLPADAKVYLDVPNVRLYYFGNFFWYPHRLGIASRPDVVKDQETLRRVLEIVPPAQYETLRARGYTHVVEAAGGSPRLVDLRLAQAAPR